MTAEVDTSVVLCEEDAPLVTSTRVEAPPLSRHQIASRAARRFAIILMTAFLAILGGGMVICWVMMRLMRWLLL